MERKDSLGSEVEGGLYTPEDVEVGDLGSPGEYPFTRGPYPEMYLRQMWTHRNAAGFGDAIDTNERIVHQLANGQTGVSLAFDLPTHYGYDTDAPEALGEFGRCGVACSSIEDMKLVLKDIPLGEISVSLTVNASAAPIWAMFLAAAEERGIDWGQLQGTLQNDILKEYVSQKEYKFPPEPSVRLVVDVVEFGALYVPRWNTVNLSGYHFREDGATAPQEIAFTMADGKEYIKRALERGLALESFVHRLPFYFSVGMNFLEEVAKFRAARRLWARIMKEEFGAQTEREMRMKIHAHTSGLSLTAQQPENNIIRGTIEAMAAVLGGVQSLHVSSMDEALGLPNEQAATIALHVQNIIAHESDIARIIDPLGGSYAIEALTNEIENEARKNLMEIDDLGGSLEALKVGYFHSQINKQQVRQHEAMRSGERPIVGVNIFQNEDNQRRITAQKIPESSEKRQRERLAKLRATRDEDAVSHSLLQLKKACKDGQNVMPYLIEAAKVRATLGEMMQTMADVFGEYREPVFF